MKKAYFLSAVVTLVGIWMLYQAYGQAQDQAASFSHKFVRTILGLVLAAGGYLTYRFARASMQQPKNADLEILTKVKAEKK